MAYTDAFPLTPDYSLTRTKKANVLAGDLESGAQYYRQKGPPQRIFDLMFTRRSVADWNTLETFRLKMMADCFKFTDVSATGASGTGRIFTCYFLSEPVYEEGGNEQVNMRAQLIEAVGKALDTYPDFAHDYPSVNQLRTAAENLGGDGYQWVYAGYGFKVNGAFTTVYLDETDVAASLTAGTGESHYIGVPLGLHRLRVTGTDAGTTVDHLI